MHKRVDTLPIEQVSVMVQNFYQVVCQCQGAFEACLLTKFVRLSTEDLKPMTISWDSRKMKEHTFVI